MPAVTALRSYSGTATAGGRDETVLLDNFISYNDCCVFFAQEAIQSEVELSRRICRGAASGRARVERMFLLGPKIDDPLCECDILFDMRTELLSGLRYYTIQSQTAEKVSKRINVRCRFF